MKLIVGLGNPGKEYQNTRHNVGFMLVDLFARKYGVNINQNKFCGLYGEFVKDGQKVILLKPQRYMNLSGEVIRDFVHYFKIDLKDLLIISDDLDQDVGFYKLKFKGSSGGHNGLKNIEYHLGTQEYQRFKIGISNNKQVNTKNYVLGRFSSLEMEALTKVFDSGINILDDFIYLSFNLLMNKYNGKK